MTIRRGRRYSRDKAAVGQTVIVDIAAIVVDRIGDALPVVAGCGYVHRPKPMTSLRGTQLKRGGHCGPGRVTEIVAVVTIAMPPIQCTSAKT